MFGHRFFGQRHYGNRYFGDGGNIVVAAPTGFRPGATRLQQRLTVDAIDLLGPRPVTRVPITPLPVTLHLWASVQAGRGIPNRSLEEIGFVKRADQKAARTYSLQVQLSLFAPQADVAIAHPARGRMLLPSALIGLYQGAVEEAELLVLL